jgi:hypothetical protein
VWSEVEENIARFHLLRNNHPNIQLQCCSTVNIFNVRYIDRLANWIASQHFDFVYWNIMHDAWYFSIATLPDEVKQDINNYLSTARIPERFRQDFDGIRDFMNNGASTDGFMLRMKIADLDRKRDQDFAHVCPEMADLIEYQFTK